MNKSKTLIVAVLILAVIGISILLYTVFDELKTSASIRNVALSFLIVGSFMSMYEKKLSAKNIKAGK